MKTRQAGFSLIEVLVTIAILMIGLLGLAALQTNATIAEMEAYQRSQALVLVQDMADRIAANKLHADDYKQVDIGLTTAVCTALTGAALDLCEWGNKLAGAAEVTAGGTKVGAMLGARGCVTEPTPNYYMVTVAWQGMSRVGAAPVGATCGSGAYGTGQRRTVSIIVRVGLLGTTT
ncbi:MAG TPA: type IV pilus modification protein PilV [Usitatibacter sp.]|nr:type IV pilus modification protein PilV [Usitatibacter sp.]